MIYRAPQFRVATAERQRPSWSWTALLALLTVGGASVALRHRPPTPLRRGVPPVVHVLPPRARTRLPPIQGVTALFASGDLLCATTTAGGSFCRLPQNDDAPWWPPVRNAFRRLRRAARLVQIGSTDRSTMVDHTRWFLDETGERRIDPEAGGGVEPEHLAGVRRVVFSFPERSWTLDGDGVVRWQQAGRRGVVRGLPRATDLVDGGSPCALALAILLSALPSLWAGVAAVLAWRSHAAAATVRPDDWVRDDDPALVGRLPAVGVPAPREHQVLTLDHSETDPSHHGHNTYDVAGMFQSGPVTFHFTQFSDHNSGRFSASSHGWTCESSSDPGWSSQYALLMRRSSDGTVIAFDCHLYECGGEGGRVSRPDCGHGVGPLVFRRVPFVSAPIRGSLRDALAGLGASLVLCWLATRWLKRPREAPASIASPPIAVGDVPFRQAPVARGGENGSQDFERAICSRPRVVALVLAAALVGSIAALIRRRGALGPTGIMSSENAQAESLGLRWTRGMRRFGSAGSGASSCDRSHAASHRNRVLETLSPAAE